MGHPRETLHVADGDTIALEARIVKRRIGGRTFVMYGFNGQYPGPLLRVAQNTRIVVRFTNSIDLPSTIHWHGLRLENRFDGVPDVTQPPVPPGGEFVYEIVFPDAGLYWYHPHVREDIQQDGGLYGNMFVDPARPDYFGPATREEFIMVDDLLVDGDQLLPWGKGASNFTIMGRFGNVMLVNGEERYTATVRPGEVVRFFVTNVSNTRSYNLSFAGLDMKLVGTDLSRFQREMMVESLVISPAERYIVEVRFPAAGTYALLNQVQVVDHMRGTFYAAVDTLGAVAVEGPAVEEADALLSSHSIMRTDAVLEAELAEYRPHFDRPVDHALLLTVDIEGLPILVQQFISIDTIYRPPVEWTDGMPNMNWLSTSNEVRWILRDVTGHGSDGAGTGEAFGDPRDSSDAPRKRRDRLAIPARRRSQDPAAERRGRVSPDAPPHPPARTAVPGVVAGWGREPQSCLEGHGPGAGGVDGGSADGGVESGGVDDPLSYCGASRRGDDGVVYGGAVSTELSAKQDPKWPSTESL